MTGLLLQAVAAAPNGLVAQVLLAMEVDPVEMAVIMAVLKVAAAGPNRLVELQGWQGIPVSPEFLELAGPQEITPQVTQGLAVVVGMEAVDLPKMVMVEVGLDTPVELPMEQCRSDLVQETALSELPTNSFLFGQTNFRP